MKDRQILRCVRKRSGVLARQSFADFHAVEQCDFGVGFERQRGGEAGGFAHIDLRAVVAGRLDESADMSAAGSPGAAVKASLWQQASWLKPLASVAVAASMAVVTVFAWQALRPGVPGADESMIAGTVAAPAAGAQTVALGPMVMVREDGEELLLPDDQSGSPTAGQDRLNAYLARHAQAASQASSRGLAPYARVISLDGEAGR